MPLLVASVPSLSRPGVRHQLWRHDDGNVSCTCERFDFSPLPKQCTHTAVLAHAEALIDKCFEAHGKPMARAPFDATTASAGQTLCLPRLVRQPYSLCIKCLVALLALSLGKVRRDYITKDEAKEKVARARASRKKRKGKNGNRA